MPPELPPESEPTVPLAAVILAGIVRAAESIEAATLILARFDIETVTAMLHDEFRENLEDSGARPWISAAITDSLALGRGLDETVAELASYIGPGREELMRRVLVRIYDDLGRGEQ